MERVCYTKMQRKVRAMGKRYPLLDGIRGLAVVNMVLFHFCYDLFMIQGIRPDWYWQTGNRLWQQGICWTFILLSGLCFHLSRRRVKNGLILNGCGLLVTAVTLIVMPDEAVRFGVLNLLGCALLLAALAEPILKKIPWQAGLAVSVLLFLLTYNTADGTLGIGNWVLTSLPQSWYTVSWLAPLGFPTPDFVSSDYFPLLPWFFLYLAGYFLGRVVLEKQPKVLQQKLPVLDWIGRHSLIIYLLHQLVCFVLSVGIAMLLK